MKKLRFPVLLITLFCVVEVSTFCGYNRYLKAKARKTDMDIGVVDHIEILKLPTKLDKGDFKWKKMTLPQENEFIHFWNDGQAQQFMPWFESFDPEFKVWVYMDDGSTRKFSVTNTQMKEKRFYYANYSDKIFFQVIYSYATDK